MNQNPSRSSTRARSTLVVLCALFLFACAEEQADTDEEEAEVSELELTNAGEAPTVSGHFVTGAATNKPMFMLGDTAWHLFSKGTRAEIVSYLDQRQSQGFNTVVASLSAAANIYGDKAFLPRADGKPDVTKIKTTTGSNAANATEYDYWDHLAYAIQQADARNMHFVLALGGDEISGDYNGGPSAAYVETPALAYTYGRSIGSRLSAYKAMLTFSIMDDRAPVYGATDKRPHYRALAEGIADGVNGVNSFNGSANYATTFMTALPRKGDHSTSNWFHGDAWLDVNSTQAWPNDGRASVLSDFAKSPTKPTWVLEGRYENYTSSWTAWSQRYQVYIPTFAGAFGAIYGEEKVCTFATGWTSRLTAPGAQQVAHLVKLMAEWSDAEYLSRVPDQSLLATPGAVNATTVGGDLQQATRSSGGTMAMVYAMNGRSITLEMSKLAGASMRAFWFNPRTGKWFKNGTESSTRTDAVAFATVPSGAGASTHTFDPPGSPAAENDWVLVLEQAAASSGVVPQSQLSVSSSTMPLTGSANMFDGNVNSRWLMDPPAFPQEFVVSLGGSYLVDGVTLDETWSHIAEYEIYVGSPGGWGSAVKIGSVTSGGLHTASFTQKAGTYVRIVVKTATNPSYAYVGEMNVLVN